MMETCCHIIGRMAEHILSKLVEKFPNDVLDFDHPVEHTSTASVKTMSGVLEMTLKFTPKGHSEDE